MYTAKQIVPFWLRTPLGFTPFYAATAQQIVRFRKERLALFGTNEVRRSRSYPFRVKKKKMKKSCICRVFLEILFVLCATTCLYLELFVLPPNKPERAKGKEEYRLRIE